MFSPLLLSIAANENTKWITLSDQIIGSEASKPVAKNTLPVLVSTGNVENAEFIEDRINNTRKPQYVKTKKRKKMGW